MMATPFAPSAVQHAGRGAPVARTSPSRPCRHAARVAMPLPGRQPGEVELQSNGDGITEALDRIPDGLFTLDHDWRFTYLNRSAERFFGRPREQLLGRVLWEVFPEEVHSGLHHELARARTALAPIRFEKFYPGPACWTEVQAHPGRDGLLVQLRDVSEQRRALEKAERDRTARVEQLEQQVRILQELLARAGPTGPPPSGVPLSRTVPDVFPGLVARYGQLLDRAFEGRLFRLGNDLSSALRSLGEHLGVLGAGPRDVIDLHTLALQPRTTSAPAGRVQAYVEEGRLLLLELMGCLASYYRARALPTATACVHRPPELPAAGRAPLSEPELPAAGRAPLSEPELPAAGRAPLSEPNPSAAGRPGGGNE
jgi:PAS domain S-box-containing protein